MRRFLIWVALLLPPFAMADDPRNWQWKCSSNEIYGDCGSDPETGKVTSCNFKEFVGTEERVCTPPDRYRDKDGNYHFDGETGGRLVLPPSEKQPENEEPHEEKKPKNKQPPEGGKQPKHDSGVCYQAGSAVARTVDELCAKLPQNMAHDGHMVCRINGDGAGIAISRVPCEGNLKEEHKQPKTNPNDKEKDNPNNGKQPKGNDKGEGSGDGSGKGSKGEGEGSGEGNGNGKGEGSGDGNGKGEGSGEGNGKGDAEGKGMFKGGAGSGNISEVRVPKSRDGLGWRGDFFLHNPNQCPKDKTMSVLGKQVVFSYAKICQYLDMLAPVVKAVFIFVAGLMVVKSIRAK